MLPVPIQAGLASDIIMKAAEERNRLRSFRRGLGPCLRSRLFPREPSESSRLATTDRVPVAALILVSGILDPTYDCV
jgi:hypothetical protein